MTNNKPSLTTRRTFVGALGLSSLSLAGVWGYYGVLRPGGHGGEGGEGLSVEEFQQQTQEFIETNKLDDGSVKPPIPGDETPNEGSKEGRPQEADHDAAVDVYVLAYQWGYSPDKLRLQSGVPYRFNMMSIDVIHGASIHLTSGSVMHRLPPGALVENELTFTDPGEYLLYCSYYCGQGHGVMSGTIIVE